jgi:hypothetical protein
MRLEGKTAQAPSARVRIAEGGKRGGAKSRSPQAGKSTHFSPFFRDSSTRRRLRHPNRPGIIKA